MTPRAISGLNPSVNLFHKGMVFDQGPSFIPIMREKTSSSTRSSATTAQAKPDNKKGSAESAQPKLSLFEQIEKKFQDKKVD